MIISMPKSQLPVCYHQSHDPFHPRNSSSSEASNYFRFWSSWVR